MEQNNQQIEVVGEEAEQHEVKVQEIKGDSLSALGSILNTPTKSTTDTYKAANTTSTFSVDNSINESLDITQNSATSQDTIRASDSPLVTRAAQASRYIQSFFSSSASTVSSSSSNEVNGNEDTGYRSHSWSMSLGSSQAEASSSATAVGSSSNDVTRQRLNSPSYIPKRSEKDEDDEKKNVEEAVKLVGSDSEKDMLMKLLSKYYTSTESQNSYEGTDDEMIFFGLCCLRSRLYRLERSLILLQAYLKWRKEFAIKKSDVDHNEKSQRVKDVLMTGMITYYVNARCLSNRGIIVLKPAKHDPAVHSPRDIIQAFHYVVMYAFMKDPELQVLGFTIITDLTGIGVFKLDARIPEEIFGALSNKLPMRYGNLIVYNPSLAFSLIFGVVRLFLSAKMKERVTKLDKKEKIFDYVGKSVLSVDLGGTNGTRTAQWIADLFDNIMSM